MTIYLHPSHRQLKLRSQRRRVQTHHHHLGISLNETTEPENPVPDPDEFTYDAYEYRRLRAHQGAVCKLRRQPELLKKVKRNLEIKLQHRPHHPQWYQWQKLLDENQPIDTIGERILDTSKAASRLRQFTVMECLF